jgi:hypothetical protein
MKGCDGSDPETANDHSNIDKSSGDILPTLRIESSDIACTSVLSTDIPDSANAQSRPEIVRLDNVLHRSTNTPDKELAKRFSSGVPDLMIVDANVNNSSPLKSSIVLAQRF